MGKNMQTLREKTETDLLAEEAELRAAIWKLRLQLTTGQLQDPQRVRRARKDLARVLTVRNEQRRAATKGSAQ